MDRKLFQYVVTGILAILLVVTVFQGYQIATLSSELENREVSGSGAVTRTTTSGGPGESTTVQDILKEITPTGTPDYGKKAGVSYDKVEAGLSTLMGYHQTISLSGNEQNRYVGIATTSDTACEFCCGIGQAGFGRSDGRIACGCSHNVAFSGLTKWLLKNTDYTDKQIVDEIQKWKVLFFPQGAVGKELERRNIQPESVGLPSMRGGC